jgi:hypothetical protein
MRVNVKSIMRDKVLRKKMLDGAVRFIIAVEQGERDMGRMLSTPSDAPEPTKSTRSWKPEVIADDSGKWTGNGLAFAKKEDAEEWVRDLSLRWTLVRDTRVVPSDEEPNR